MQALESLPESKSWILLGGNLATPAVLAPVKMCEADEVEEHRWSFQGSREGYLEMRAGHVRGLNASQASAQSLLMHSRASSKSSGSKQPT